MPQASRKAGQNVRELAAKRRVKAITSFAEAGLCIGLPFFLVAIAENFFKQTSINLSQSRSSLNLLFIFYVLFAIAALSLATNGMFWWKRANHADQGAKGEEEMAQELSQLNQEGWEIEYSMRLGNRLGDADIVCTSPQNKAYVIDVKSHRGEVTTDGKQLLRRMADTTAPFEKSFLDQAMKQALQVKKQKGLRFVTPIVAFSNARVLISENKVQKVYVVEKSKLTALLRSLG